ncbi:hypothetical protein FOB63_001305 [Clavispora lusitaniae]|uniref:Pre-mRNA-processing factor n=2 Tax=Clavispora lusitaniae TaxID=36911 RepID=C4Y1M7_CLAL4|nr:uncharacterized protein CLUG_02109 [Clavispora lusitaniae ATCC 42720]EEQ37986.1 hypothetical protein CLUG_02109 [Clavispora lusitaniae ATCC 42720]KAF7583087.1 hypothetical protein FOB63_001305 [Clavispora lusitaniae]
MSDLSQINPDWHSVSIELLKNPFDLDLWQQLVHCATYSNGVVLDKTASDAQVHLLRVSFDSLLHQYPLLSKYWTAYAEWEFKLGFIERANTVYLKGLTYVGFDLSYWLDYLRFKLRVIGDDTQEVLELFEEARLRIGFNFHASDFYLLYLSFLRSYATKDNGYYEKSIWLIRSTVEIPLYNYSLLFREMMEVINPKSLTFNNLHLLIPDSQLKTWKTQTKNNLSTISKRLEKTFTDAYVVNQYKSYQIYSFEKNIVSALYYDNHVLSTNQIESWKQYLDFAEQNHTFSYVCQLYERSLVSTAKYCTIVLKFVDYLVSQKKFSMCRQILRKFISVNPSRNDVKLLIRLVDLEVYLGYFERARDIVVNYLALNKTAPNCIYSKLFEVESMFHFEGDDEYLSGLALQIIRQTKSLDVLSRISTRMSESMLARLLSCLNAEYDELDSEMKRLPMFSKERLSIIRSAYPNQKKLED